MRTKPSSWAGALILALSAGALADAPNNPPPQPADPPDPPGTTLYMGRLRAQFVAWDLDGDGFLDKSELAKAFRGTDAKPYDYKKPGDSTPASGDLTSLKKPDYSEYPDYNFLIKLDQDGDGMISRAEFMT